MGSRVAIRLTAAFALAALFGSAQRHSDPWEKRRAQMVREQIEARGVRDPGVLAAMRTVQRERFVPSEVRRLAAADSPLPIGHHQTISQPYIVAFMTELLRIEKGHRVLEIGTGSGYQSAVLAELSDHVHSIEIVPALAARAAVTLRELGYSGVKVKHGDGYLGWPEHGPYDRIIVTAAPPDIPEALVEQLAPRGRMVAPVGRDPDSQRLVLITKDRNGNVRRRDQLPVRFVPMVSSADRN
ncbi:MAG: protein-L-isoaspartate(D-aspartate) O-methyltransferase [Bryobacterales bacterium]|nr:protein-L-isoaspartate(D-aspartate) O-methyltransferase [Bryobacterales bacterium]MDE0625781.1 protein-L-isoaspartate(D-aspartate) O-methyltransferase [Bryobacterales bacterium]